MSIIRAPRPESNFYVLDKKISEDRRLSWAARGILIFLLGKPDNWKVSIQALINETSESGRPMMETALYAVIHELLGVGYLQRKKHGSGHIDYFVHEIPVPPEPKPENPNLDNPNLENPNLDFKGLTSTEVKTRTDTETSTEKNKPASRKTPIAADFGISERVKKWAEEKGHQNLDIHLENFIGACKANGYTYIDWDDAFMNAIRNDWAKLKYQGRARPAAAPKQSRHSGFDKVDYSEGIENGRIA